MTERERQALRSLIDQKQREKNTVNDQIIGDECEVCDGAVPPDTRFCSRKCRAQVATDYRTGARAWANPEERLETKRRVWRESKRRLRAEARMQRAA